MNLPKLIVRALRAGPHEWQVRSRQAAFTGANWAAAGWGRSALRRNGHRQSMSMDNSELGAWWRDRRHRWFVEASRRQRVAEHFDQHPAERARIVACADAIASGKMPVFSHPPVSYTGPDRWQRDHILGVSAPQKFHAGIRYLDVQESGDSKHTWEPNRFGWAYPLGVAHVLTGEERYVEKFCELTADWFRRNPYPLGINYCSSLELAIRAYAWIWALELFRTYVCQHQGLLDQVFEGVWLACRHIENTLSYYFAPNTHLLGEAFALYACGAAIPEYQESSRWRRLGSEILAREARKQIHADGTHRELSSCYQLYTTDFYLQATLISRETGFEIDPLVPDTARRLALRVAQLAPADAILPQLNDCDGGRLTWFCQHPLDALPTLTAAGTLFDDFTQPVENRASSGYDLWMAQRPPRRVSPSTAAAADCGRATPVRNRSGAETAARYDSGIVTYRNSAGDYLLFRSGPFGYMDCGHSHDAPTSFVLYFEGQPLVVDNGTGAYTQSMELRNRFRCAGGKNILLVNGRGPSEPDDWFAWKRKTTAYLTSAGTFADGFRCRGYHEGFTDCCGFGVHVSREITLFDSGIVGVIDRWNADSPIDGTASLTLSPQVKVDPAAQLISDERGSQFHFLTCQLDETMGWSKIPLHVEVAPYSGNYGSITDTRALSWDLRTSQRGVFLTLLSRIGKIVPARTGDRFGIVQRPETISVQFDGKDVALALECEEECLAE